MAYDRQNDHAMDNIAKQFEVRISVDKLEKLLMFDYDPGTEDALFDIVDPMGRIVKTGDVVGPMTRVRITDLSGEEYFLMVLDGERSMVHPIHLRQAS